MTTGTTPQPAPLLDLQALVVAVRRRRRLWSAAALLGLLGGGAVAVLMPPPPTAVTEVLVAHEQDQPNDPGTLIRTDAALLHTTRIAEQALKALKSPVRAEDFMKDYTGAGVTNNLLRITVTGASDAQATARAKALADAFVADHVRRIQDSAAAQEKALLAEQSRLRDQLAAVDRQIGDGSGQSGPKAADLESLFAQRAELTSRISDFGQRAAEAGVGTPQLIAGTQIVDGPSAVPHSLPKAAATDAAIGTVLGLVLGLALAAVTVVVADRPVLRRDIAAHLGASVIAELPYRRPLLWRRRRARLARERLAASLARTVLGAGRPVSLLELGCARQAGALALDVAGELGPVTVVDGLPKSRLAKSQLVRSRSPKRADVTVVSGAATPREHLLDADAPARQHGLDTGAAARQHSLDTGAPAHQHGLGVGSLAPGTTWADLRHLAPLTILVVRAGHASAAHLHTVARHLDDQRIEVIGVVLVDPDPRDRTDGTLWDTRGGRAERPVRRGGAERPPMWAARTADSDLEAR